MRKYHINCDFFSSSSSSDNGTEDITLSSRFMIKFSTTLFDKVIKLKFSIFIWIFSILIINNRQLLF